VCFPHMLGSGSPWGDLGWESRYPQIAEMPWSHVWWWLVLGGRLLGECLSMRCGLGQVPVVLAWGLRWRLVPRRVLSLCPHVKT